jgi:hypothetical protein
MGPPLRHISTISNITLRFGLLDLSQDPIQFVGLGRLQRRVAKRAAI